MSEIPRPCARCQQVSAVGDDYLCARCRRRGYYDPAAHRYHLVDGRVVDAEKLENEIAIADALSSLVPAEFATATGTEHGMAMIATQAEVDEGCEPVEEAVRLGHRSVLEHDRSEKLIELANAVWDEKAPEAPPEVEVVVQGSRETLRRAVWLVLFAPCYFILWFLADGHGTSVKRARKAWATR